MKSICRGSFALSSNKVMVPIGLVAENPLVVEVRQCFLGQELRPLTFTTPYHNPPRAKQSDSQHLTLFAYLIADSLTLLLRSSFLSFVISPFPLLSPSFLPAYDTRPNCFSPIADYSLTHSLTQCFTPGNSTSFLPHVACYFKNPIA